MPPKSKPLVVELPKKRKRKQEDDEDDEENEEEEEIKSKRTKRAVPSSTKTKNTKVKKAKAKSSEKKSKSSSAKSKSAPNAAKKSSKSKQPKKLERLEEARKAYKWWEAPSLAKNRNWNSLEHPGVLFPPSYVRHNVPFKYDGQVVPLNSEQEEIVSFYAAMPDDGLQLGNPKTRPVFQKNFFDDFKEILGNGSVIKKFEKCDFSLIRQHLENKKNLKKAATDEEKLEVKLQKEVLSLKFGYALIDGRIEKMGNYNMEPPGLFRGRGEHPKTGKLKKRCFSESVNLNLSEDACVPKCNLPGHAWNSVQHDPAVTWLCSWNENVQNQTKYVMLAASSSFKGKSDLEKYAKAIRLKKCIEKVRRDYTEKLKSQDLAERQLGTAMWVIDKLALRVGGEKGEDEADTVGCCSLRVEHFKFQADNTSYELELEFFGKDSMLFKQTISFSTYGDIGKRVYNNIKSFCKGKPEDADVFETLVPAILNKHLNSLMPGLSAKVFRTYNASVTLEEKLPTAEELDGLSIQDKITRYNAANREVAILCNHQRTVSKATEVMFENLNEKLATMKEQLNDLVKWKELAKKSKESKIPLKDDDKDATEKIQAMIQAATKKKETAKTDEQKLQGANELEAAKALLKQESKKRFVDKHMYKQAPSETSIENRIQKWNEDIRKLEVDIRNRDENKEVALGTSKINYMDPRISVAWCKRCEIPIDKVFAKTLRDKFNWAMAVTPEWKFE
eukprot:gene6716-9209_t